jgi:hypothetical protein
MVISHVVPELTCALGNGFHVCRMKHVAHVVFLNEDLGILHIGIRVKFYGSVP